MYRYLKTLRILYTKELQNYFSRKKDNSYQKFLIAGYARTGTTLLHTYLNSHPNIISAGEKELSALKTELLHTPQQESSLFHSFAPSIKAVGAKVLLSHELNSPHSLFLKEILQQIPSLKIIHLKRENLLKWYLSLQIAHQHKRWSQTSYQRKVPLQQRRVCLPVQELLSRLKEASRAQDAYQQLFREAGAHTVSYESLSNSPHSSLKEVQQFLGLKPKSLSSLLQKQNPEPLPALIHNYEEVARALHGTPFQVFLENSSIHKGS